MGTHAIINFLVYAIVNAFTPGPGNILALNTVTNYGWRKGKKLFFGIFAGYYVVQTICAIFIYGLDEFLSPAMTVMKYFGVAYIVWLAIHIAISSPSKENDQSCASFWKGCILQFVNVKIYLFGVTALSGYVVEHYTSLGMLLFFGIIIATIGTIATSSWILLGGLFQRTYTKYFRAINIVLALVLLECAWGMFVR